jgi:hypothetical protein
MIDNWAAESNSEASAKPAAKTAGKPAKPGKPAAAGKKMPPKPAVSR